MSLTPETYEYAKVHKRIRLERGRAHMHKCVDCDDCAMDWSWNHDTDENDIRNYKPRCRLHHIRYDLNRQPNQSPKPKRKYRKFEAMPTPINWSA